MPDVLNPLSIFIRDLYGFQKIDKKPNFGGIKVTLFAGVVRTNLYIREAENPCMSK
jgi:hypothetical protein